MVDLRPAFKSIIRPSMSVMALGALLVVAQPVAAQTVISREIQSMDEGFCFVDTDNNGSFTSADVPTEDPAMTDTSLPTIDNDNATVNGTPVVISQPSLSGSNTIGPGGSVVGADFGPGTYNVDITGVCIGGTSRTDLIITHVDDDGDSGTSDTDDDGVAGVDTTTASSTVAVTSGTTAIYDDDGFTLDGNVNLTFAGQVDGDVEFTGATQAGDVTLVIGGTGAEITGALDLGTAGADNSAVVGVDIDVTATIGGDISLVGATDITATLAGDVTGNIDFNNTDTVNLMSTANAAAVLANNINNSVVSIGGTIGGLIDVDDAVDIGATISATAAGLSAQRVEDGVFTLSGALTSIDFDAADNITITSSTNATTLSARNVVNGLTMSSSGQIGTLDLSGTSNLNLTFSSTAVTDSLVLSDIVNATSSVDNAGGIGTVRIDNTSAVATVDFNFTNSGSISASLDEAFLVQSSGGGAVHLDLTNSGTIAAASSDALQIQNLQNGVFNFVNTGTLSTSAGTNNAISASGVQGSISITNGGTAEIESTNNLAMNFQNMVGQFSFINAGRVQSNQTAINLTGASAVSSSAYEICNGYTRDGNGNCEETDSGTREIKATGSNAIVFDGLTADMTIFNAAGASIIAEDRFAIAASGVAGSVNIQNKGDIRAYRASAGASNEQAIVLENISGDVTFANIGTASRVDALDRALSLETTGGALSLANAGTISTTQNIAGVDALATDNYALRLTRSGAASTFDSFTNSGTISSTSDHAVLASGLVCDDARAADAYCLTNSGTLRAERQFAFVGSNISDLSFSNSGTITARDRSFDASDLSGDIVINSSSAILATYFFDPQYADPDAESYAMRLAKEVGQEGDIVLTNSGTISAVPNDVYEAVSGEDNVAAPGSAVVVTGFTAATDSVRIENTGTISTAGMRAINVAGQQSVTVTNNAAIAVIQATDSFAVDASAVLGSFTLQNTGGDILASSHAVNAPSVEAAVSITSSGTIRATNGVAINAIDAGGLVTLRNETGGTIESLTDIAFDASNAAAGLSFYSHGTIAASGVAAVQAAGVVGARSFDIGGNITNSQAVAINAGNATSTLSYSQSGGTVKAAAQTLNFTNAASAVTMSVTGGKIQSLGTEAVDLANAGSSISLTNAGVITAIGTTLNMQAATGAITLTNQAGGQITSTGAGVTAIDMAGAASVSLTNAGLISAADKTIIATGLSGSLAITNNSGGVISSLADEVINATAIDNASLVNHGTVSGGASGTLITMTGDNVTVTNSGTISGGSTALLLGNGATLVNSGSIAAASATGTALQVQGTGAQITLNDGSVLLGDIVSETAIADPADRHQISLNLDVSKSFVFEFNDRDFTLSSTNTAVRPVVEGSAHAVSPYMTQNLDVMHATRAASLRQNFYRETFAASAAYGDVKFWGQTGERDASSSQPYSLDVTEYGSLASARLFGLFGGDVALLLAYETIEMEIAGTEQMLEGDYVGLGFGLTDFELFEGFTLDGYLLGGQSSNDSKRKIYGNKLANGMQQTLGSFDTTLIDVGLQASYQRVFGRAWHIKTSLGFGLTDISSDGFDEGEFYRHGDNEATLSHAEFGLRVAYDLQEGYIDDTDFIYVDVGLGEDSFSDGDTHNIEFLDADIDDADAMITYTDADMGGQQSRVSFGYQRLIDGETAIDLSVSRRFMDDGLEMDEARLSVFVRF